MRALENSVEFLSNYKNLGRRTVIVTESSEDDTVDFEKTAMLEELAELNIQRDKLIKDLCS